MILKFHKFKTSLGACIGSQSVGLLYSVFTNLSWSLVQQLQSVLNSTARLIFGLRRFDHITPAPMDLHWLPYPQHILYKLRMIMTKCLHDSSSTYLADYYTIVLLWCMVDRL